MKLRLALAAVVAVSGVLVVAPGAFAQSSSGLGAVPVTAKDKVGPRKGNFKGVYRVTKVRPTSNGLLATGTVEGVVKSSNGKRARVVRRNVQALVSRPGQASQAGATCQILFLDIQPITLRLLGLNIEISRITIRITGDRGPGNLLGNLLCGLFGLLDRIGPASLAGLLDRLGPDGVRELLSLINRLGGLQGPGLQNLLNLLELLRGLGGLPAVGAPPGG